MSAWEGVDLAAVREAVQSRQGLVQLELETDLFGGPALMRVAVSDPRNPRRKPKPLFPGPLIADSHAALLRAIADVLDGTIESLVVTDPRDDS